MKLDIPRPPLKGKKALIVGVANDQSIAYGCAKAFHELGAEVAITYVNEKTKTYVEPLLKELGATIFMPLDVAKPGELEAVFEKIDNKWGGGRDSAFKGMPPHKKSKSGTPDGGNQLFMDGSSHWTGSRAQVSSWVTLAAGYPSFPVRKGG